MKMIDASKLKYYKTLCEKGVLDGTENDLDSIKNALEKKQLEYLKGLETTMDETKRDEIKLLLNTIELQKKEVAEIQSAVSSGILEERSDISDAASMQVASGEISEKSEASFANTSVTVKKRSNIPVIVAAFCIAVVAIALLLHNANIGKKPSDSEGTESSNNSALETNQNGSEGVESSNQANNQLDDVSIIKDGKYVITCGELKEVLLQRFRTINPTLSDYTENNFEKSGYFVFGSKFNGNGDEETEAILVKVLPPTGNNSYDEVIQSYSIYSDDENDLSKYYAEAIRIADPSIDVDAVQALFSKKYNELKENQPNDESVPIDFLIWDFNSLKVYFAVDRGAQWCVITDPSMDFLEMFNNCVNAF